MVGGPGLFLWGREGGGLELKARKFLPTGERVLVLFLRKEKYIVKLYCSHTILHSTVAEKLVPLAPKEVISALMQMLF